MKRTKLAHIHGLSTSGHIPQVRSKLLIPINNHRNSEKQNYSISEIFVDINYNLLDLTSK
jgi:hypothetical protein